MRSGELLWIGDMSEQTNEWRTLSKVSVGEVRADAISGSSPSSEGTAEVLPVPSPLRTALQALASAPWAG